jgi:hypothetical protein
MVRSIFRGVPGGEPCALITSYSDVVDFLKSSKSESLIAIGVESERRSIARSLSGRGPKGEPDDLIVPESEIIDLLRRLKLIRRLDSSMLAIRVEVEYRFIARLLSV